MNDYAKPDRAIFLASLKPQSGLIDYIGGGIVGAILAAVIFYGATA